ncbi:glycosyltransferase [Alteromonas sp. ASW11-130]|uniref:glycosyltransferase n=1 Tax=Alteromonas sp. ASW11-130 TaxID=3015775 RepID=UPI002242504B|nr:glycosyltransferase [Alteromonas sp. ASW11-130]MCW8092337.1 glycosyltransferase [Alteromonas sp. ASW11-130]
MKIIIIAHPRFPIASPYAGGLEAFTASLIEYYQLHHEVILYAHPDSKVSCELRSFPIDNRIAKAYPELVENDYLLRVLEDIKSLPFDIIHNNAISALPPIWAAKNDVPMLTTLHTPPYTKLKVAATLASYSPFVHYNAISYCVAEQWRPYVHHHIDVIYNGIDLARWRTSKTTTGYLFAFGRITPAKGFDLALKAANLLELPLLFAGPVYDKTYYTQRIKPNLKNGSRYLGHLDHIALQKHLEKAKAVVFGTRWDEPFGLATVEAMATSTPVASFARGAFPEIVSDQGGVLAEGNTVNSLAEAIEGSFKLHPDDVIGRAGKFPLATMCQNYLNKLEGIVCKF